MFGFLKRLFSKQQTIEAKPQLHYVFKKRVSDIVFSLNYQCFAVDSINVISETECVLKVCGIDFLLICNIGVDGKIDYLIDVFQIDSKIELGSHFDYYKVASLIRDFIKSKVS